MQTEEQYILNISNRILVSSAGLGGLACVAKIQLFQNKVMLLLDFAYCKGGTS